MKQLAISAVTVAAIISTLTACGQSNTRDNDAATFASRPSTVTVGGHTPPSKREIIQSRTCLERERLRPARHASTKQGIPHGADEVTRNGLPMTPQEYGATVRKCLVAARSGVQLHSGGSLTESRRSSCRTILGRQCCPSCAGRSSSRGRYGRGVGVSVMDTNDADYRCCK
jgi:hypothetical protein